MVEKKPVHGLYVEGAERTKDIHVELEYNSWPIILPVFICRAVYYPTFLVLWPKCGARELVLYSFTLL
jgi:hypothetical protein